MRVCVVGGGIGGLGLARGLAADGHEVVVLERSAAPAVGGAAVTIFSNGMAAASGLGVDLSDLGGDVVELTIERSSGQPLVRTDLSPVRRKSGFPIRTMPRARLIERLGEGLTPEQLRYGAVAAAVRVTGAGAVVELADGGLVEADVVVGADGNRSATRAAVLADGSPSDVGWLTWQGLGVVLPEIAAGHRGRLLVGSAGLAGFMPAGDGLTQWWFDGRSTAFDASGDALSSVRKAFGSYGTPVPELLATIGSDDGDWFSHVLRNPAPPWGRGAVTLLGDAAHAFPLSQAQGANQALEDAWLLRRALAAAPSGDVPAVLRRYERRRAQRVGVISRMAASERTNRPPGAALGALARCMPPGVAGWGYLRLIRRISSVLRDEVP